ncbi:MAG: hypothetical protein ACLRRG_04170 [Barnesiella sp.]
MRLFISSEISPGTHILSIGSNIAGNDFAHTSAQGIPMIERKSLTMENKKSMDKIRPIGK